MSVSVVEKNSANVLFKTRFVSIYKKNTRLLKKQTKKKKTINFVFSFE